MSELPDLLEMFGDRLVRYCQRRAGRLTRYETLDDIVQGVRTRALERGSGFTYQGEAAFAKWLWTVADSYLADRFAYWMAQRRKPAALLRLTGAGSTSADGSGAGEPAAHQTGPITFAERREHLEMAQAALDLMLQRDRDILERCCHGDTRREIAAWLEISPVAAEKARERAFDRFRKAFTIVERRRRG